MAMTSDFLQSGVIFLSAAVVAVPIAQRLGLGSVLGYLLAGVAIGPWGLGLISDVDEILHFSEFGVVLLLFLIGLELNPKKLWQMRIPILGLGGAQVVVTTLVLSAIASLFNLSWQTSLAIGMGLALSSTAIALRVIEEQGLGGGETGQSGFAVLLFQDIAVIPMLALLPLLAGKHRRQLGRHYLDVSGCFRFAGGRSFSDSSSISLCSYEWGARIIYCCRLATSDWYCCVYAKAWVIHGVRDVFSRGVTGRK